jgi:uncharacterized membrane protein YhaH (DUF805 family)
MMFCANCGTQLNDGVKFCTKCGTKIEQAEIVNEIPQNVQTAYQQSVFQQNVNGQFQYQQPSANIPLVMPKKSGWQYFVSAIEKYAVFSGRSRRSEYWYYALFLGIINIALNIIYYLINANGLWPSFGENDWIVSNYLKLLTTYVFFMPGLAVYVRRLHDVDKSGWFILVPIYNIILVFKNGTKGTNRFGNDPKQEN